MSENVGYVTAPRLLPNRAKSGLNPTPDNLLALLLLSGLLFSGFFMLTVFFYCHNSIVCKLHGSML